MSEVCNRLPNEVPFLLSESSLLENIYRLISKCVSDYDDNRYIH